MRSFDFARDARKSAVDPSTRLADQDADGVLAEVIYPSYVPRLFYMRDAELQRACVAVYNDWISEYCQSAPRRLFGMGAISLVDAALGAAELERCLARGLHGATIWCTPPPELSFASRHYERFWAAAAAAGVPITLHALPPLDNALASPRVKSAFVENQAMGVIEDFALANVTADHLLQRSLTQLILSGVLERHPKLQLVISEWGTGWIPHFLRKLDSVAAQRAADLSLTLKPSEYFARQIWITYERDIHLPAPIAESMANRLMWASDFPHVETSWPDSQATVTRSTQTLSTAAASKIMRDNCAALFMA